MVGRLWRCGDSDSDGGAAIALVMAMVDLWRRGGAVVRWCGSAVVRWCGSGGDGDAAAVAAAWLW